MPQNKEQYKQIYDAGKMMCEQGQALIEMAEGAGYMEDEEMTEELDIGDDLESAIEAAESPSYEEMSDKKSNPALDSRKRLAASALKKKMGR